MFFEVVDNIYFVMFYNEGFCKSGWFIGNVLKIGFVFVFVVMVLSRYKKICYLFFKVIILI